MVLTAHKRKVTSLLEISKARFATCSLDRTVILWDNRAYSLDRSNITPEVRIEEHAGSVLSLAHLPLFHTLISVGCEKKAYVWSVDVTGYRGLKSKLTAHQANLVQVSAGQ